MKRLPPFNSFALTLCLIFICLDRVHGQGGPPLITDDANTPGKGNWEINLSTIVEKQPGTRAWEAPLLDLNYGLGGQLQLTYQVPWVFLDEEDQTSQNGLGNSLVGVKWRFMDENKKGIAMSVYPQLTFNNPTASARRGLVEEGTNLFLPWEASKNFGRFSACTELGYDLSSSEENTWAAGVAAGVSVTEKLELLGEIRGTASQGFDDQDLACNIGFRHKITEEVGLLFSVGRSLWASGEDHTEAMTYLGIQFTFGRTPTTAKAKPSGDHSTGSDEEQTIQPRGMQQNDAIPNINSGIPQ